MISGYWNYLSIWQEMMKVFEESQLPWIQMLFLLKKPFHFFVCTISSKLLFSNCPAILLPKNGATKPTGDTKHLFNIHLSFTLYMLKWKKNHCCSTWTYERIFIGEKALDNGINKHIETCTSKGKIKKCVPRKNHTSAGWLESTWL